MDPGQQILCRKSKRSELPALNETAPVSIASLWSPHRLRRQACRLPKECPPRQLLSGCHVDKCCAGLSIGPCAMVCGLSPSLRFHALHANRYQTHLRCHDNRHRFRTMEENPLALALSHACAQSGARVVGQNGPRSEQHRTAASAVWPRCRHACGRRHLATQSGGVYWNTSRQHSDNTKTIDRRTPRPADTPTQAQTQTHREALAFAVESCAKHLHCPPTCMPWCPHHALPTSRQANSSSRSS